LRAQNRPFRPQIPAPEQRSEFAAKATEVVGRYIAPSDNAIVLAVDEKPSTHALEGAQGHLKLPNGAPSFGVSARQTID